MVEDIPDHRRVFNAADNPATDQLALD